MQKVDDQKWIRFVVEQFQHSMKKKVVHDESVPIYVGMLNVVDKYVIFICYGFIFVFTMKTNNNT